MISLLKLEEAWNVEQYGYDTILDTPPLNETARRVYPQALIALVMGWVKPNPHERITADALWQSISDDVTAFPAGLRSTPKKVDELGEGDLLRYNPDQYVAWAG